MTDIETALLPKCSLCGEPFTGYGNNPYPLADREDDGPCCDDCNSTKVIPARLANMIPRATEMAEGLANGGFGQGKTVASFDKEFEPFDSDGE